MLIKRLFIAIALTTVSMISAEAQSLDFEKTGFEIKAVAMQEEKSVLAYHVSDAPVPSRFNLRAVLQEKQVAFSPLQEQKYTARKSATTKDPVITIAPLKQSDVFAFGRDGSINGVKNIAYKPASGGNIADAYCRAIYASRSGN